MSAAHRSADSTPAPSYDRRRTVSQADQIVERALARAFAPLHKRVFGLAVGITAAVCMALLTTATLLIDPKGGVGLGILSVYFRGYDVSPRGIVVGAAWAGFVGFVVGWFMAFCRNLVLATWLLFIRARATFAQTRDFLDHI